MTLAAFFACSAGFVTISQSYRGSHPSQLAATQRGVNVSNAQQSLGFLWHSPEASNESRGLGMGITWAWDGALCPKLLPRFKEDFFFVEFLTCKDLKAAMHRAFASWAQNHPLINFVEVTEECKKWHTLDQACPLAEIWVTHLRDGGGGESQQTVEGLTSSDGASVVEALTEGERDPETGALSNEASSGATAATALPTVNYTYSFRYTNGATPFEEVDGATFARRVIETHHAVLSFNVDQLCWYLDSTWCHHFHSLKPLVGGAATLLLIIRCVLFSLWALAIAAICLQFGRVVCKTCDHGSWVERIRGTMDVIGHWSVIMTTIRFILLVGPPAIYWMILLPCWDCYDFEGAATHEVGHVLGLSHPDYPREGENVWQDQMANGVPMGPGVCEYPWDGVRVGTPPAARLAELGETLEASGVRDSIMEAFTQHNPSVCLTADDLEALNTLYPVCEGAISTSPVCEKSDYNIGWVRLMVWVILPAVVMMVLVFVLQACVRKHHTKRLASARNLLKHKSNIAKHHRNEAGLHKQRAEDAEQILQYQLETEQQRVEEEARKLSTVLVENEVSVIRAEAVAEASRARAEIRAEEAHKVRGAVRKLTVAASDAHNGDRGWLHMPHMSSVRDLFGGFLGRATSRDTDIEARPSSAGRQKSRGTPGRTDRQRSSRFGVGGRSGKSGRLAGERTPDSAGARATRPNGRVSINDLATYAAELGENASESTDSRLPADTSAQPLSPDPPPPAGPPPAAGERRQTLPGVRRARQVRKPMQGGV